MLVLGFLWVAWDAFDGFAAYQHTRWIWQSQHLQDGENIKRADAINAMRDLSIALKDRHRVILAPVVLMLTGGLVAAFGPMRRKDHTHIG
jgi:hypothetical protein